MGGLGSPRGERNRGVSKGEFGLEVGAEMEAVPEIELGGRRRPWV